MKSVMTHDFARVPQANIPRSVFDRSHGYKTALDASYLVPVYLDHILPGDTFNVNATMLGRLNTPVAPIMDNLHIDTFYFFVPYRLIWTNFYKFMGGQDDPGDSTSYTFPTVPAPSSTGWTVGSLADYFGIPPGIDGFSVVTLPFRAYNLIWNEWFRDQNLQDSVVVDVDDGPDTDTDYVLLKRGKRHDYFTSCLPWPQKGDAQGLGVGNAAPITGLGKNTQVFASGPKAVYETDGSGTTNYADYQTIMTGIDTAHYTEEDPNNAGYINVRADLSASSAVTIDALIEALALQRLAVRDARGGTRYTEIIRSHFGVISPDARLQRPEFLGGSTDRIQITPVANTEGATNEQGYLTGYGTALVNQSGFSKSFTEHGLVIGLVNIRADITYQQGLDRFWSKSTRYDLYWPALAHLGEQSVLDGEIFLQGTSADDDTFGYQERWAEYRYKPSQITGILRSDAASSLDLWHLSEDFASLPVLDSTFIPDASPVDRIVATPAEPHLVLDCYFNIRAVRPLPTYSVPGLGNRF